MRACHTGRACRRLVIAHHLLPGLFAENRKRRRDGANGNQGYDNCTNVFVHPKSSVSATDTNQLCGSWFQLFPTENETNAAAPRQA
jgi:hypothetical protein